MNHKISNLTVNFRMEERLKQPTQELSLCQVNVGNFPFFFMVNIFSYKTAVIDGSFRLSPLVCFLAVVKFLSRAKPHVVQSTLDRNFTTAFL